MEKEFKLSWLKVIGVIALIAMIIVVIFLVYPKKKSNGDNSSAAFINNINLMKDVAYDYFKGDNLPDKIGEAYKITLEEMITNNMIVEFVDDKGNTCNKVDSYVQVTKSLENEYTMKVFLSCDDKSDYVLSSFYVNDEVENNKNEKEEEKVEENNKVSDNKVNNNSSSTQGSSNNYKPNNNVTYVTNYNINYVNNCKNCVGSSCLNSCVNNVYYTVSFDADGGTNVDKQTVKHGETAVYKNTTREGYDFLGWYLDGNKYDFSKPVTKKITLVAKWEKIEDAEKYYIVNFETNGGSKINSQTILEGKLAIEPNGPTKTCYVFAGWYIDSSLTKTYDFDTPVTQNITLYAKWKYDEACREKYTVSFNSNGGTNINSQEVLEGNKAYQPLSPTKYCYVFAGWYIDSSLTKPYDFDTPVTQNITLYAKWTYDINCFTGYYVNFNSNGGSSVPAQTVWLNGLVKEPADPTKSCYIFAGWYIDSSLTRLYDFDTPVTRSMTLYAKWLYNPSCNLKHKVYFNSNGGSVIYTQTVNDGARATKPVNPTKSDHKFLGWYLNGEEFNFNTRIYEDIVLEARWEEIKEEYYTYCVKGTERIYSTGFINNDSIADKYTNNYNYVIKLDKDNVDAMKVTKYGNIEYYSEYTNAYNYWKNKNKSIEMVNWNGESTDAGSASNLRDYSLKSSNFTPTVTFKSESNNEYYFNVNIKMFDLQNLKYVAPYFKTNDSFGYFVPLYFDIEYAKLNNCFDALASYKYLYSNYVIVDSYYK